jgi:hypothetical protein
MFFGASESIALNFKFSSINNYKETINKSLQAIINGETIETKCKLAAAQLSLPWKAFEADICDMTKSESSYDYYKYRFLTLFLWAAKNNRADLFETESYKKLFELFPEAASDSILAAAAYGCDATDYLRAALQTSNTNDIMLFRNILCIAIMENSQPLLFYIIDWVKKLNGSLKTLSIQCRENDPLKFAIQSFNDSGLDCLLMNGMDPNKYYSLFLSTLLHEAVYKRNKSAVACLLQHGMNVNAKSFGGTTPLHDAIRNNEKDIARMLVEHKADLFAYAHDLDNEPTSRPIDYIRECDHDFKDELLNLSQRNSIGNRITAGKQ